MISQEFISAQQAAEIIKNQDINQMSFSNVLDAFDKIFYECDTFNAFWDLFNCNYMVRGNKNDVFPVFKKLVNSVHFKKLLGSRLDGNIDIVIGSNDWMDNSEYLKLKESEYEKYAYAEQGCCSDFPDKWNTVIAYKPLYHPEIKIVAKEKVDKFLKEIETNSERELNQLRATVPENVAKLIYKYRSYPRESDTIDDVLHTHTEYSGINYFANYVSGNAPFDRKKLTKFIKKYPKFEYELDSKTIERLKPENRNSLYYIQNGFSKTRKKFIKNCIHSISKGYPVNDNNRYHLIVTALQMLDPIFRENFKRDKFQHLYSVFIKYLDILVDNISPKEIFGSNSGHDLWDVIEPLNVLCEKYDLGSVNSKPFTDKIINRENFDISTHKISCAKKINGKYERDGVVKTRQEYDPKEVERHKGVRGRKVRKTDMHFYASPHYGAPVYEVDFYGVVEQYYVRCANDECGGRHPDGISGDIIECSQYYKRTKHSQTNKNACIMVKNYKPIVNKFEDIKTAYFAELKNILVYVK